MSFATRQPIRFGWHKETHSAIGQGAFQLMPPSWLKQYGMAQARSIRQHDENQDLYFRGPGHFINLGVRNNGNPGITMDAQGRQRVLQNFSPRQRQQDLPILLDPNRLATRFPQGPNVFQSILSSYTQVKSQLADLMRLAPAWQAIPEPVKQARYESLNRSIGQLEHYVGDFYMPLHTTRFHDWLINGTGPKMHQFIEGDVFSPQDLNRLASAQQSQTPWGLTEGNLPTFLLTQLGQTHLTIYDIVQLEKQSGGNLSKLRQSLKPLLFNQAQKAKGTLSALLQLAATASAQSYSSVR